MMKKLSLIFALGLTLNFTVSAQDFKMPAPSPATHIKQDFSTTSIELQYSRPSVKDRKIFGDLVPYGQVWRTGANGVTKITFHEDVVINGMRVAAGSYALYTIPKETEWEFILNKGLDNWGVTGYDTKDDVLRTTAKPVPVGRFMETFTISFDEMTKKTCKLVLAWEKTAVAVDIFADNDQRIKDWLSKQLSGENPPYLQASQYYLERGENLENALGYADQAIKANPKAFYIHSVKAEILNKLGRKSEAVKEAKIAADGAKGTPYEAEYQSKYQRIQK